MRNRYDNKPLYKKWYYTKRWKDLRRATFLRDGYMCQCGCKTLCVGRHPASNSPVCDHIVKHEGDEALFWDKDNLQTLTRACHDGWKQRLERSDKMQRVDGW